MSFDKYMQSYNHHHNLPKTFLLCLCGQSHPFILASGKHSPDFYLYRFMFSRIQYKCNHICLASFTYHNAKIYLCCWVYQWFFFFLYYQVEFFCMHIPPQCIYPFTRKWTFGLLLLLGFMNVQVQGSGLLVVKYDILKFIDKFGWDH